MNDSELITAVRESVTGVHTATPVDQIVHRRRALRGRRRLPGVAAVMAVATGAALATNALVPSGQHPASSQLPAQLAAWTVVKRADGNIHVTIRELRDPSGLQAKLRADGVPASVMFSGQMNRSCRAGTAGANLKQVFTAGHSSHDYVMVIHPSALPAGIGVQINPFRHSVASIEVGLVHTSAQCTGT